jgi:hypothetical protein
MDGEGKSEQFLDCTCRTDIALTELPEMAGKHFIGIASSLRLTAPK